MQLCFIFTLLALGIQLGLGLGTESNIQKEKTNNVLNNNIIWDILIRLLLRALTSDVYRIQEYQPVQQAGNDAANEQRG